MWCCPGEYITNHFHFICPICKNLDIDYIYHIFLSPQIGNRFALTAAHCLYDNSDDDNNNKELLPASSFSIMLGLHNRSRTREPNRWLCCPKCRTLLFVYYYAFLIRRQIRVIKVLVHENFTNLANDIALLKLGKIKILLVIHIIMTNLTYSQKREWIFQSSALPVFLTTRRQALLVRKGTSMVSSQPKMIKFHPLHHLRLGRHWSSKDLHRHAARDSSSHRPDQQLCREN